MFQRGSCPWMWNIFLEIYKKCSKGIPVFRRLIERFLTVFELLGRESGPFHEKFYWGFCKTCFNPLRALKGI